MLLEYYDFGKKNMRSEKTIFDSVPHLGLNASLVVLERRREKRRYCLGV